MTKIKYFLIALFLVCGYAWGGQVYYDPLAGEVSSLPGDVKFSSVVAGDPLGEDLASQGVEIKYDAGTPSDTSDDTVVGSFKVICQDETNMHFPLMLTTTTDDLDGASIYHYVLNYLLADDATITMPTGKMCWGFITAGNAEEYIHFIATSAGEVTLLTDCSTNTANTDSDGDLCIYDGGSGIVVKNRLAAEKTIRGNIWMDD